MIAQIIFVLFFTVSVVFFSTQVKRIIKNIKLGKDINRSDLPKIRWLTMVKVALGQSKMVVRPVAGIMHILVYVGFVIINLEVLEIIIDGIFGTHRIFSSLGSLYNFLIGSFEILALLVLIGVIVFLMRRVILRLKRFSGVEMSNWPKSDALYILIIEVLLMSAFLTMNAADYKLQLAGFGHYTLAGSFPISQFLLSLLPNNLETLVLIERSCWWFHILGIFAFLNYLPFSKHLHIILAFPNTWYSNLNSKGKFSNMESVQNEVKAMFDATFTPPVADQINRFGAKDVQDLNWVQLMNAYSCTECGRCTSVCPANLTGKVLSPRKIMMDTRDRLEEVGKNVNKKDKDYSDEKSLLDNYISREEIWACTTCNACTDACPINIDPLSIILDLRRYAVMEEANVTGSLNAMFANIENNGAPWKYAPSDRLNWVNKS
jgi:heterodisulfide reductase subunit C